MRREKNKMVGQDTKRRVREVNRRDRKEEKNWS